jgi:hypothetical protein
MDDAELEDCILTRSLRVRSIERKEARLSCRLRSHALQTQMLGDRVCREDFESGEMIQSRVSVSRILVDGTA